MMTRSQKKAWDEGFFSVGLRLIGCQYDPRTPEYIAYYAGREVAELTAGSAAASLADLPSGVDLIAAERDRQIHREGYTAEHDASLAHRCCELTRAAICYARQVLDPASALCDKHWPWDRSSWKPSPDPIRNLTKAGAMIAAEIDRIQNLKGKA